MGNELSKALGVPAILTNKAGGGGAVGAEYVARAEPDGYTVLACEDNAFNILPFLTPGLHYKLSDFIPLCKYATSSNLILVRKGSPFKSLADIIADAKKNPGTLTYGIAAVGTQGQLSVEVIKLQTGIDIAYLAYKSGGEVMTSLLGGHVNFACTGLSPAVGLLRSGDLRALASIFGKISGFPNVPTMEELGYPKATFGVWIGYYLPKGTPQPIVEKLAAVFEKAMKNPNPVVMKNLEASGLVLDYQDGTSTAKLLSEDIKIYEDVLRKANIIK